MIDSDFHVYLIEANVNPCLEIFSPITAKIIPNLLDNIFRYTLDSIFQPQPEYYLSKKNNCRDICPELKFELIYDSLSETRLDSVKKEHFLHLG